MKWYGEALTHNPKDVEALWGFGSAASRLDKNLELAEEALRAAYQRAPANGEIAMALATIKGKQDKPEEMIPYLQDTIRFTTNLHTLQWATDTLQQMQSYIVERDKIEAANRKEREEYEKKLAEYEKKYGKPKKKPAG
jgi:hypothetical protein